MHPVLQQGISIYQRHGFKPAIKAARSYFTRRGFQKFAQFGGKETDGEHVFARNWDILVVLDACRYDAVPEVAGEYDFLSSKPDILYSVGGSSGQWMKSTFDIEEYPNELDQTAYVTGNPHSQEYIEDDKLAYMDEVWRRTWDDNIGTIQPRSITNAAIHAGRNESWSRLIIHYMQPHSPFIPQPEVGEGYIHRDTSKGWGGETAFQLLAMGELSYQEVWDAYIDNLRYVLEEVKLLKQNIDAETLIISADHGELFGEYSMVGHPSSVQIEQLRKVPWVETSAVDKQAHDPPDRGEAENNLSRHNQLEDLGYK